LQNQLNEYININRMSDAVNIAGFKQQDELKRYYLNSDIFVLPCIVAENNDVDGLPNVILEAMASGVPVISTPVSAITEIIENRLTGLLIKEKDGKALANAILELKNDSLLYEKIAENARIKVGKFSIKESTSSLVEIFKNTLHSNPS